MLLWAVLTAPPNHLASLHHLLQKTGVENCTKVQKRYIGWEMKETAN